MSAYLELRYHQATYKASHNSYQRKEIPVFTQLSWNGDEKHNGGCRGLELDIQQSPRNWDWSVAHIGGYNGDIDQQLSTYLRGLATWSDMNPDHDVITVLLDLKDVHFEHADFPRYFDAYLEDCFPVAKIFAPSELMTGSGTLLTQVRRDGWPRLKDMRNRFVFCLSGNEERKSFYARHQPEQRLCFSDKSMSASSRPPGQRGGHRVFYNFKLSDSFFREDEHEDFSEELQRDNLVATLKWFQEQQGLLARGYDLNTRTSWNRARKFGLNMLSTDKVQRYKWATVGAQPFARTR